MKNSRRPRPTTEQAELLGVEPGSPLLLITRTSFTEDGVAVEFSRDYHRSDRARIRIKSRVESGSPGPRRQRLSGSATRSADSSDTIAGAAARSSRLGLGRADGDAVHARSHRGLHAGHRIFEDQHIAGPAVQDVALR